MSAIFGCDSNANDYVNANSVVVPLFHPEYGRFMLESTPGAPYSNKVTDLLTVEGNMRYRFGRIFFPVTIFPDFRSPQGVRSPRST